MATSQQAQAALTTVMQRQAIASNYSLGGLACSSLANLYGQGVTLDVAKRDLGDGVKTLLVVGSYSLAIRGEWVVLALHSGEAMENVAWWKATNPPTRALIAASIRHHRLSRPRVNARDEFGALLGVRYFALTGDYHLRSPVQHTVWMTNVLMASAWSEEEAVRGTCGIHAAWPSHGQAVPPRIDSDGSQCVVGAVRGMGKFVTGKEGWRAERVIVDTVYLPPSLYSRWRVRRRMEKLYPEIAIEEEPWTLEKSSRLARPIQKSCR